MGKVHPGATLTPHFRDFLPPWTARQPWYGGTEIPTLRPVGYFRLEDPAGEVGIETHIVYDGTAVYQIPMTYRGAPLPGIGTEDNGLIATAAHSVLGTRWIYDATVDPVWIDQTTRLVLTGATTDPSSKAGAGPASAVGRLLEPVTDFGNQLAIEVVRNLTTGLDSRSLDRIGVLHGTWHPDGSDAPAVSGTLAVVHRLS